VKDEINSLFIRKTKTIRLFPDNIFNFEQLCKSVEQFFLWTSVRKIFCWEHNLIAHSIFSRNNCFIVITNLRLLCRLKTIYKSISLVLQRLNSFSSDRNVETVFVISIESEIRNYIKHCLKERQPDRRMRSAIVRILS